MKTLSSTSEEIETFDDLTEDEKEVVPVELFCKIINSNMIECRQKANLEIIDKLKSIIDKFPELRFQQILYILNISEKSVDKFNEESVETLKNLNYEISSRDII